MRFNEKKYLIPIIIFLIAFLPRIYYMNDGLFHTDSVFQAMALEKTVNELDFTYMHPPGYAGQVVVGSIVFLFHKILTGTQSAEFAATFTSILMGSLACVAMYYLGEIFTGNRKAGIYSAIILSFTPVFLSVTTYAKSHATETFFIIASAYYALKAGQTNLEKHKLLTGFCLGFAASVRITSFMLAPILLLFMWEKRKPLQLTNESGEYKLKINERQEQIIKDIVYLFIFSAIVFAIPNLKYFMNEGLEPFTTISKYAGFMGFFSPMLDMSINWILFSLKPLGAILLLAGILLGIKNNKGRTILLITWTIMFTLYLGNLQVSTPRYLIPSMIPMILFMGIGLSAIEDKLKPNLNNNSQNVAAIILIILVYMMFTSIQPIISFRKDYCGPKQFSLAIKENTQDNAVIIGMDENQHYIYYANRQTMGHPITAETKRLMEGPESMMHIEQILNKNIPLYVTYPQGLGYDQPIPLRYDPKENKVINAIDGVVYENIGFNHKDQLFYDKTTSETLPINIQSPGAYTLLLFNHFKVTKVTQVENEDWHRKSIQSGRITGILFKIELRQ